MEMWNAKRQSGRKFHLNRPVQGEVYNTPTIPRPQDARPRSGSWGFWGSRNSQAPDYIPLDHIDGSLPWEIKQLRSPICL